MTGIKAALAGTILSSGGLVVAQAIPGTQEAASWLGQATPSVILAAACLALAGVVCYQNKQLAALHAQWGAENKEEMKARDGLLERVITALGETSHSAQASIKSSEKVVESSEKVVAAVDRNSTIIQHCKDKNGLR